MSSSPLKLNFTHRLLPLAPHVLIFLCIMRMCMHMCTYTLHVYTYTQGDLQRLLSQETGLRQQVAAVQERIASLERTRASDKAFLQVLVCVTNTSEVHRLSVWWACCGGFCMFAGARSAPALCRARCPSGQRVLHQAVTLRAAPPHTEPCVPAALACLQPGWLLLLGGQPRPQLCSVILVCCVENAEKHVSASTKTQHSHTGAPGAADVQPGDAQEG